MTALWDRILMTFWGVADGKDGKWQLKARLSARLPKPDIPEDGSLDDQIEKAEEARQEASDQASQYPPLILFAVALLLVGNVDLVASFPVLRGIGVAGGAERIVWALLTAVFIVALTYTVHGAIRRATEKLRLTRLFVALLAVVLYIAFSVAVAWARVRTLGGESGLRAYYAPVAITLCVTLGPGWIADWLIRSAREAFPARRRLHEAKKALARMRGIRQRLSTWRERLERCEGIYRAAFASAASDENAIQALPPDGA